MLFIFSNIFKSLILFFIRILLLLLVVISIRYSGFNEHSSQHMLKYNNTKPFCSKVIHVKLFCFYFLHSLLYIDQNSALFTAVNSREGDMQILFNFIDEL